MQKEMIHKEEIRLIGLSARTNNKNEMNPLTSKIADLAGVYWVQNVAAQISNRKNPDVTFSVYTDYASDEHGDYTYFIGEEVSSFDHIPPGFQTLTIPAAKYQKLTTPSGKMPEVVIHAWQKIWNMSANDFGGMRAYVADFELYDKRASNPLDAVVDIHIGLVA